MESIALDVLVTVTISIPSGHCFYLHCSRIRIYSFLLAQTFASLLNHIYYKAKHINILKG